MYPPGLVRSVVLEAIEKSRPRSSSSALRRCAEPSPSAATTTVKCSASRSRRRLPRPSPSPTTGPQPLAPTIGESGDSGVAAIVHTLCCWPISRSVSACRRGKATSASRAHVLARVRARSSSSASRSLARSRIRRGSTSTTLAVPGRMSVISSSPSVSHGSQLSIPSNSAPSARRSHCSRPHGCSATSLLALARTSSSGTSSRAGKISTSSRSAVLRWSLTLNVVSRSTSSPHRSMRTGASAVDG